SSRCSTTCPRSPAAASPARGGARGSRAPSASRASAFPKPRTSSRADGRPRFSSIRIRRGRPRRSGPPGIRFTIFASLRITDGPAHGEVVRARVVHAAAPLLILVAAMAAVSILWLLHGTSTPWLAVFGLLVLFGFAGYLADVIRGGPAGASWLSVSRLSMVAVGLVAAAHVVKLMTTPRVNGRVPHDAQRTTRAQWNSGLLLTPLLLALRLAVAG